MEVKIEVTGEIKYRYSVEHGMQTQNLMVVLFYYTAKLTFDKRTKECP
jgi:hypothetical protein